MAITIDGTGTISGVSATGLTTAQNVGYAQLPTGSVLQVVNATYSVAVSNSTSSYVDTGLTATITPKFSTSKILVIVNQNGCFKTTGNTYINLPLLRNGSVITTIAGTVGYNGITTPSYVSSCSTAYLDSPATTSSIIYKTQIASGSNIASVSAQGGSETSTITLMEIAG